MSTEDRDKAVERITEVMDEHFKCYVILGLSHNGKPLRMIGYVDKADRLALLGLMTSTLLEEAEAKDAPSIQ